MRDPEFHEFDRDRLDHAAMAWVPPKPDIWQRLSRLAEVVLYILLIAGVLRIFQPEIEKQRQLNGDLSQILEVKADREARVAELRQEYELLKTDREYLETVARDRLDKARDGEYIVRIEREAETIEVEESAPPTRAIRPIEP